MDHRSRGEQFFILVILFVSTCALFCATGCKGDNCETPKCGSSKVESGRVYGCSIPGIGGCLTPKMGGNTVLWPQACKAYGTCDNSETDSDNANILGCDVAYLGGGCGGCGNQRRSCYSGCLYEDIQDGEEAGKSCLIYFGRTEKKEVLLGCVKGVGCVSCKEEHQVEPLIELIEMKSGVY